jgi:hypothetical protein
VAKCDRCGCESDSFEIRSYGYDSSTGYTDEETVCDACIKLAGELARLDREVERGFHHAPALHGDPMLQTDAATRAKNG